MSRFFFHVIDGKFLVDTEGTELSGLAEARAEAVVTAGEIIRSAGLSAWDGHEWQMHVTDADKKTVLKLTFSAQQLD
jgi:hypothetical protein